MRHAGRAAAAVAALAAAVAAQQAPQIPHVGYVYPAGGRRGASIEVRVGGQFLNGASTAYVSGQGVRAIVTQYVKPPTPAEAQKLRDEIKELREKRAAWQKPAAADSPHVVFTAADRKRVEEIREKLEEVQRRPSIAAIAEIAILHIDIAPDAALGPRQLRLDTKGGLTNPIVFCVGELPEFSRKPVHVAPAYNVVNGATPANRAAARQPEPPMEIALPAVVNGQMTPGTADEYRFRAKRGQHIVIEASARELIPYVSDAVPGWFQAALTLRDAQGKELASADHFRFHPDPLIDYVIASDGEYIAQIHDSIYRGREDFVYRIAIGELPVIASIFPLGGKAGTREAIEAQGWNLPAARIDVSFRAKAKGVYPISLRKDGWTSNSVPFALDTLPEAMARAGIVRREKAQKVKLPVIVNGRVGQAGEAEYFRIDGRAGDEIVAEVTARRLGSPLDSVLRLTDAAGEQIAFNDDFEDPGAGLLTHQADSLIACRLPAKGSYYLQLTDAQSKGGPEYGYRLRISHPRPDFELRVVPSSLNLRAGATVPVTVRAIRRDGFAGEIALNLKDAPAEFLLSGAAVPAGQDKVRVTLTAPRTPASIPLSIQLIGRATIGGHEVTHNAIPAQDMEQAFAYHHLVAEDAWMVRVIGEAARGLGWRAVEKPVRLQRGGNATVDLFVPPRFQKGMQLALNEPPEGISIQSVTPKPGGVFVVLRAQADKAKPGSKGNLILDAFREVAPNPAAANQTPRRQPLGTLPAIPFEVVDAAERK
ncbi:MAG: hypothetical protein ACLQKA_01135 [Bryobacteraceae bacterium]